MNLRQQIGQLIIAGVEGTTLSDADRAWMRLVRPGGVILFRRNIEEAGQVTALLRGAAEIAGDGASAAYPQFRCIDLEGGLVDRLRDLIAPMPSAAAVFRTGRTSLFKKHGELIGAEARTLGFNVTFAPVLDLALPESTEVMRTRVVSPDADGVVRYASAFLDGLAEERVLGCGKHFPGLGGGTLDSHTAMPAIARSWEQVWEQDIAPYRALSERLPFVMVAHAAYPHANDGTGPASISQHWIVGVLRQRVHFKGLVISDDMEMGGILTQASIEDAAIEAILAGTDVIEICRNPVLVVRAWEALLNHAEHSPAFRRRIHAAWHRVASHKKQWLDTAPLRKPSSAQMTGLRKRVKTFAERVIQGAKA